KILKPNFRLICSTNVNVESALKDGRLREDLYYRVNTLTLTVPPLRDRQSDIPVLAEYFLQKFAAQHERQITTFHPDAIRTLVDYAWPGNVRELQHIIERAVILAKGPVIGVDDLPDEALAPARPASR
ncbi:MAG TPA: sigma 54-interacting transcriptional regulator, partial [Vicinamibacterales bacterium]|nr:sigma 54-interacting transcriptional regulator [Vicinamibacterales bacterium]